MVSKLKIKQPLIFLVFFIRIFSVLEINAQDKTEPEKLRHQFAESSIGLSFENHFSGRTFIFDESGHKQEHDFQHFAIPKIHFGGLHFWGHSEIYFAFSLIAAKKKIKTSSYKYSFNDVFGINIYPWPVEKRKLRPYIGISISGMNYEYFSNNEQDKGPLAEHIIYPLALGMTYRASRAHLLSIDLRYNYQNRNTYYIAIDDPVEIEYPRFVLSLSYRYIRESTRSAERDFYNGKTQTNYERLKKEKKLNSFFIGIGPSSAFLTNKSSHFNNNIPYIGHPLTPNIFLDMSAGYYFENPKLHVELSYRGNKKEISAYGTNIKMRRKSLLLSIHRQLFDYHGFVPYLGVGGGYDWLNYQESSLQHLPIDRKEEQFSFAIITGWDILPDKLQYITLRTNIRYFPQLKIKNIHEKDYINFNQIEFNFIQIIFYPGRWRNLRNL